MVTSLIRELKPSEVSEVHTAKNEVGKPCSCIVDKILAQFNKRSPFDQGMESNKAAKNSTVVTIVLDRGGSL